MNRIFRDVCSFVCEIYAIITNEITWFRSKFFHTKQLINSFTIRCIHCFNFNCDFDATIIFFNFRNIFIAKLIATNQKFKKNQKFDSKKSNQVWNVKFEICFNVKFKFFILMSNSNSNRHIRLEICFDVKSNFFFEFEIWFEKFDLIWNTIYKK